MRSRITGSSAARAPLRQLWRASSISLLALPVSSLSPARRPPARRRRSLDRRGRTARRVLARPVGTRQQDHPAGEMRQRGPHLVAVDYPLVAARLGEGLHAREVRSRARLAEALAPDLLAGQQLRQQLALELLGAVVKDRRRSHAQTDHVGKIRRADALHLLVGDALAIAAPAAAVLHGVIATDQTGVISRFLPGAEIIELRARHDLQRRLGQSHRRGRRDIRAEPAPAPGAEFGLLGRLPAGGFGHGYRPRNRTGGTASRGRRRRGGARIIATPRRCTKGSSRGATRPRGKRVGRLSSWPCMPAMPR